ncbi:alanine racemase [Mesorhizobium australicum]|uniref:Alanine racemase n=1 Tax=Mesorhizobium australicum TaxID=536018 RepID=A0ACC6T6V2_9HYPH
MNFGPVLKIELRKITHNATTVRKALRHNDHSLMVVVKGCCGDPNIVRAIAAGGISQFGDSRMSNLERLREANIKGEFWLLRSPAPDQRERMVELCNGSLQSDLDSIREVEQLRPPDPHRVILMVDLGTGREGFQPNELLRACDEVERMTHVELYGLGIYFMHGSDPAFVETTLRRFGEICNEVEGALGRVLKAKSFATSLVYDHILKSRFVPSGLNHLRLGTVPIIGRRNSADMPTLPGLLTDTAVLEVKVIQTKILSDRPIALLEIGDLDTDISLLRPIQNDLRVIDSSSDHTVVEQTPSATFLKVGDSVEFTMYFTSFARLMSSPYVAKRYRV